MNKTFMNFTIVAALGLNAGAALGSSVTIPNSFSAGTPALADEVNDNFNAVAAGVNDNDSRVTTNTTATTTNAGNITNNTTAIGTNTTDIGTNATDIGTNATDIGTNATDIATNVTDIATNAAAITTLENSVNCSADMVAVGSLCVDIYESSVWDDPTGTGTQFGAGTDDYPCLDDGSDCGDGAANPIYAVSRVSEQPSSFVTWYQASQACGNVGKRLPSTAEWQLAAFGTVGGLNANLAAGCNTNSLAVSLTGQAASCDSTVGASDMIGNLWEWVAELESVPSTVEGGSNFVTTDQAFGRALGTDFDSAASGSVTTPKALLVMGFGGSFANGPNSNNDKIGFRCVR